jgi:hypothetical protein
MRFHHPPLPAPARNVVRALASCQFPLTTALLSAEARGDVDLRTDVLEVVGDIRAGSAYTELGFTYARDVELPVLDAAERLFATAMRRSCIWHPED